MKRTTPGEADDLAAADVRCHEKIHRSVVARIWELHDGGLDVFEIAATTGFPVALVRAVLRGAETTAQPDAIEIATDRPSQSVCALPPKKGAK